MDKIGIFFGTDTGCTRLIAKTISRKLGADVASKPVNVNRIDVDELLKYDALILGTPTYGEGVLPGRTTGIAAGSWEEFLPQLKECDLSGKKVALYGLGNQEKYSTRFANSLYQLYDCIKACGADVTGAWSTEGYTFEHSDSVVDGKFVGLVIDQNSQRILTDERLDRWLAQVKPTLLEKLQAGADAVSVPSG